LFLDEIAELPAAAQAKLLRVVQEGCFEPVGSNTSVKVDVRLVSATHRDLPDRIRRNLFREDLYYRINVIGISVPPLRERPEDVPLLAAAMKGQIKTDLSLSRIATLLPLAGSIDSKNIQQVVLLPPYTRGCGCPDGYVLPDWGAILPLVHTYFP